jgi:hypothetical protein
MLLHHGGLVSLEILTIIVTVDYDGFENWIDWMVATSMCPLAAQINRSDVHSASSFFCDTTICA